jgi:dihydrofolate synthase / folylpolyglutamate synthase
MTPLPPDRFSDVDAVLEWLAGFTDFEQKQAHLLGRRSLDLSRIRRYCAFLGHPERGGYTVAHVAGSKGKGSTCAFLERLALDAGIPTGLFLSPHLVDVRERIRVNGASIGTEDFLQHAEDLRRAVAHWERRDALDLPSFFESMVLMAFLEFRRHQLAIVEVGLGGRLDATNVVPKDVAVITRLDLEHTRVLGPDLDSIGWEKAGILVPGAPLVTALEPGEEGGRAVHRRAEALGCEVLLAGRDFEFRIREEDRDLAFPTFSYRCGDWAWDDLRLGTPGAHQVENAALALTAARALVDRGEIDLDPERIPASLRQTRVPARQELIPTQDAAKIGFSGPLLLDSAHTPRSMQALSATIPDLLPERPRALMLGLLRDKDLASCIAPLRGLFDLAVTAPPDSPRALEASALYEAMREHLGLDASQLLLAESPEDALAALQAQGAAGLVVTGSVYLAGALRSRL